MAFTMGKFQPTGLVFALVALVAVIDAATWNYDASSPYGPHNWNQKYGDYCDPARYPRQSPINIRKGFLKYDSSLKPMKHEDFDTKNVMFQAQNNGHTAQFVFDGDVETQGGPVDDTHYYALQMHFHWGNQSKTDGHGSEHTILGQQHQVELHIVHVNHKHSKLEVSEVVKKDDGLLVLGIFIDVADPKKGQIANPEFYKITEAVKEVRDKAGSKYNMTRGDLNLSKILPTEQHYYYTYPGGLTTPDCHGAVTWVIYRNPIYITQEQLDVFFTVKDSNGVPLTNIFRPPQPVNKRVVRSTHPSDGSIGVSAAGHISMSFAFIIASIFISLFL